MFYSGREERVNEEESHELPTRTCERERWRKRERERVREKKKEPFRGKKINGKQFSERAKDEVAHHRSIYTELNEHTHTHTHTPSYVHSHEERKKKFKKDLAASIRPTR